MKKMVLPAEQGALYPILDFVREFARQLGFTDDLLQIELAVEEILINIASYAYDGKGGMVSVSCAAKTSGADSAAASLKPGSGEMMLQICFVDSGIPHDPFKRADPDITLPSNQRPIGGLGIFLVKEFMDNVFYEYKDGTNILTIEKILKVSS